MDVNNKIENPNNLDEKVIWTIQNKHLVDVHFMLEEFLETATIERKQDKKYFQKTHLILLLVVIGLITIIYFSINNNPSENFNSFDKTEKPSINEKEEITPVEIEEETEEQIFVEIKENHNNPKYQETYTISVLNKKEKKGLFASKIYDILEMQRKNKPAFIYSYKNTNYLISNAHAIVQSNDDINGEFILFKNKYGKVDTLNNSIGVDRFLDIAIFQLDTKEVIDGDINWTELNQLSLEDSQFEHLAINFIQKTISQQSVKRSFLGLLFKTSAKGVIVEALNTEYATVMEDIGENHIISSINGNKVQTLNDVLIALEQTQPSDTIELIFAKNSPNVTTQSVYIIAEEQNNRTNTLISKHFFEKMPDIELIEEFKQPMLKINKSKGRIQLGGIKTGQNDFQLYPVSLSSLGEIIRIGAFHNKLILAGYKGDTYIQNIHIPKHNHAPWLYY